MKIFRGHIITPVCREHGAMNKVSRFEDGGGYWRCVAQAKGRGRERADCRAGCIEIRDTKRNTGKAGTEKARHTEN